MGPPVPKAGPDLHLDGCDAGRSSGGQRAVAWMAAGEA